MLATLAAVVLALTLLDLVSPSTPGAFWFGHAGLFVTAATDARTSEGGGETCRTRGASRSSRSAPGPTTSPLPAARPRPTTPPAAETGPPHDAGRRLPLARSALAEPS
jgi:hypothetical protein